MKSVTKTLLWFGNVSASIFHAKAELLENPQSIKFTITIHRPSSGYDEEVWEQIIDTAMQIPEDLAIFIPDDSIMEIIMPKLNALGELKAQDQSLEGNLGIITYKEKTTPAPTSADYIGIHPTFDLHAQFTPEADTVSYNFYITRPTHNYNHENWEAIVNLTQSLANLLTVTEKVTNNVIRPSVMEIMAPVLKDIESHIKNDPDLHGIYSIRTSKDQKIKH